MNKLPNAQFSQVEVNNGCQPDEESTTILQSHTVWVYNFYNLYPLSLILS